LVTDLSSFFFLQFLAPNSEAFSESKSSLISSVYSTCSPISTSTYASTKPDPIP
jgi:hypothetical protein